MTSNKRWGVQIGGVLPTGAAKSRGHNLIQWSLEVTGGHPVAFRRPNPRCPARFEDHSPAAVSRATAMRLVAETSPGGLEAPLGRRTRRRRRRGRTDRPFGSPIHVGLRRSAGPPLLRRGAVLNPEEGCSAPAPVPREAGSQNPQLRGPLNRFSRECADYFR